MRKLILSLRPILYVASFAVLFSGCATLVPTETCEQFEARRKQVNYATEYRRDEKQTVTPMRKGFAAMAMQYRLRLEPERVRSCSHVTIHKELVLSRRDDAGVTLEETREFFAEDGTRIAIKNENLSNQLRHSGRYTASVLLPIPKNAPAGAYHLVSTLILKMKGSAENQVLAKTTISFEVVPSK
jgi:hypothetical protein